MLQHMKVDGPNRTHSTSIRQRILNFIIRHTSEDRSPSPLMIEACDFLWDEYDEWAQDDWRGWIAVLQFFSDDCVRWAGKPDMVENLVEAVETEMKEVEKLMGEEMADLKSSVLEMWLSESANEQEE